MNVITDAEFEKAVEALRRDWSFLGSRLRTHDHRPSADLSGLNIRLHYPAFRRGRPTVEDLVDVVSGRIAHFCLPRAEVEKVYKRKDEIDAFEFHAEVGQLNERARRLFQKARGNSGELGEVLLFILTEWVLRAPQILAKMSLKTNSEMPVHGSDGIHVRYDSDSNRLFLFTGESKLHKDVRRGISAAARSIAEALSHDAMAHEIQLVQRNVDFSGLDPIARTELLRFLDPFDDASNDRVEVVTCLIGFDFAGYAVPEADDEGEAERAFLIAVDDHLHEIGPAFAGALEDAGLPGNRIELFFLPLPSVQDLRDRFTNFVGPKS